MARLVVRSALVLLTIATVFAGWRLRGAARAEALPRYGAVPAFSLQDQDGRAIGRADLLGKVTLIDFVFTSCSTACPILSREMARLSSVLPGDRVQLVSISVDPERDTPARLRAFAAQYGAVAPRWRFLRGDERALRGVVVDGLLQVMDKQADPSERDGFTILHGTRIVLLDPAGELRGFYDANDREDMARLEGDARALQR